LGAAAALAQAPAAGARHVDVEVDVNVVLDGAVKDQVDVKIKVLTLFFRR
jgi:hypothetical protein